jgi:hypothetical protein
VDLRLAQNNDCKLEYKFKIMFSKLIKLLFVATAFTPILLIWWFVSIYNIFNTGGGVQIIDFRCFKILDLFNVTNLILLFLILVILCLYILHLAKRRLTRNYIGIKSIKSADLNMTVLIFSYFLPCIEIYNKELVFKIGWIVILFIIVLINKGTYFYNPLMKLFGFRYYEISTINDVTYLMISKKKIINVKSVNAYSQLTDYVILNASK